MFGRVLSQSRRYFIRTIDQSVDAYRETFGANPVKLSPGLTFGIPFVHRLKRIDMREGRIPIKDLIAYTKDNVPIITSFSLFYKVEDSYKACYNVQNYLHSLRDMGTSTVRTVIGRFDYDQIISERNTLTAKLVNDIGNSIQQWGVMCTRAEIQEFGPQSREVQRQLELQMEAERKRRENELISQALINTAEAKKREQILVSEGQLESDRNRAEGQYILAMKEADAKKYALEASTKAIVDQLNSIKESVGSSERASAIYLENVKLQNMKSIAEGPNNKVYFIPSEQNSLIPAVQAINEMIKS